MPPWKNSLGANLHFPISRWCAFLLVCTASCGGGPDSPVVANPGFAQTLEDNPVTGLLSGHGPQGAQVKFLISRHPPNGRVTIDADTGHYTYAPAQDFNGVDSFEFRVTAGAVRSAPAVISIRIDPVNDPPTVASPGPRTNDPDHYPTVVPLDGRDVDGDALQWAITTSDPELAQVDIDPQLQVLLVRPRSIGDIIIGVRVSDGYLEAETSFQFSIRENETERLVLLDAPDRQGLEFRNSSDIDVAFKLDINNRLFPGKRQDVLAKLAQIEMPESEDSIQFRIWRAIAENTRRGATLSEAKWLHAPVRLLNSTGFGYCDDVASAFSLLANEAGLETRAWTLGGHVVPEVRVGDRWEMYDPDTGVVYYNEHGQVASVEELTLNTSLITTPRNPAIARKHDDASPFSQEIADIYASIEDNVIYSKYTAPVRESDSTYTIPAGGRLVFSGSWSNTLYDQPTGHPISFKSEALLELPAGWLGTLPSAFVVTGIDGAGSVRLGSTEYELGSADLAAHLSDFDSNPGPVKIGRADSPIAVTFLISAVAGALESNNRVVLTGINTGAVEISAYNLPDANQIGAMQ